MPVAFLAAAFAPAYRLIRYRLAWFAFAAIIVAGSIPGARAEIGQVASGYVLHMVAYAGITFLLVTGARGTLGWRSVKAVLTVAAMGAADELVQSFLPYRRGAAGDWMIDVGSSTVMAAVLYLLARRDRAALARVAQDAPPG